MTRETGSAESVKKTMGEEFDLSPSSVDVIPEDVEDLKYLESAGSSQALLVQQLAMLLGIASPPTGMAGGQMTGVYSGSYANTRIAYEKTWYKDPFKIHEDVLAVVMGRAYQIIDQVIRHPISVRSTSVQKGEPSGVSKVGPSNIRKYYDCKVKLLADSPEAADIKKHLGIMAFQAGLYDHEGTLVDYFDMGRKEAEETVDKRRIDEVEKSPMVMEALAIKTLENSGQDDIAAFIKNMGWQQSRGGSRPHPGGKSEPASKVAPAQTRPSGMEAGENPTQTEALQ